MELFADRVAVTEDDLEAFASTHPMFGEEVQPYLPSDLYFDVEAPAAYDLLGNYDALPMPVLEEALQLQDYDRVVGAGPGVLATPAQARASPFQQLLAVTPSASGLREMVPRAAAAAIPESGSHAASLFGGFRVQRRLAAAPNPGVLPSSNWALDLHTPVYLHAAGNQSVIFPIVLSVGYLPAANQGKPWRMAKAKGCMYYPWSTGRIRFWVTNKAAQYRERGDANIPLHEYIRQAVNDLVALVPTVWGAVLHPLDSEATPPCVDVTLCGGRIQLSIVEILTVSRVRD